MPTRLPLRRAPNLPRFLNLTPRPTLHPTNRIILPSISSRPFLSSAAVLLSSLSPTYLPWSTSLPLLATLLRSTTTLPLTLHARLISLKLLSLSPLLAAWGRTIAATEPRTEGPQEWEKRVRKRVKTMRKEVLQRAGAQRWRTFLPLVQVPVWFGASLVVRGMTVEDSQVVRAREAGEKMELARETIQAGTVAAGGETTATAGTATATTTIGENDGMVLGRDGEVLPDGATHIVETTTPPPTVSEFEPGWFQSLLDSIPYQPSLAEGGMLWFPDLLAPDPLYILPVALSVMMYANIEFQSLQYPPQSRQGRIIKNILRTISLAAIPVTMQTPTALTLYWLSSALFSFVQNVVLHYTMPLPKPVKPLKPRPLISFLENDPTVAKTAGET